MKNKTKKEWTKQFKGPEYSQIEMLRRAVTNARPDSTQACQRWVAVKHVFGYGNQTSNEICIFFNLDSDEIVKGSFCGVCEINSWPES